MMLQKKKINFGFKRNKKIIICMNLTKFRRVKNLLKPINWRRRNNDVCDSPNLLRNIT